MSILNSFKKRGSGQCAICQGEAQFPFMVTLNSGECLCSACKNLTLNALADEDKQVDSNQLKTLTVNIIKDVLDRYKDRMNENRKLLSKFNPTYKIEQYIWFDDDNKMFVILNGHASELMNAKVYMYEDIVDYGYTVDGASKVKRGVDHKLASAALFAATRVVAVQTSSRVENYCTQFQIVIEMKNQPKRVAIVDYLNGKKIPKPSNRYRSILKSAQETLSKLESITSDNTVSDNNKTKAQRSTAKKNSDTEVIQDWSFSQSPHFRGFKKIRLSTYNYQPIKDGIDALKQPNQLYDEYSDPNIDSKKLKIGKKVEKYKFDFKGKEIILRELDYGNGHCIIVLVDNHHVGTWWIESTNADYYEYLQQGKISGIYLKIEGGPYKVFDKFMNDRFDILEGESEYNSYLFVKINEE